MDEKHVSGELAEFPKTYGKTRKATPKSQVERVFAGENLVWRIDPSLAATVASGKFADENFGCPYREVFMLNTIVIFLTADPKSLARRRKQRPDYDEREAAIRDQQDEELLAKSGHFFSHVINNPDGDLEQTIAEVFILIEELMAQA